MKNLFAFEMVTLDGFFEGTNQELDWHNVDEEFNEFADAQLSTVDALLFGRVTYELMASYWPSATENDPAITQKMNSLPKIVFSRTLDRAKWSNSRIIRDNIVEEVRKLKQGARKDLALFGSAMILSLLMQSGLIDELRLMVNPVVLGSGNSLFRGIDRLIRLRLLRTKAFRSGNVLLCYQPVEGCAPA